MHRRLPRWIAAGLLTTATLGSGVAAGPGAADAAPSQDPVDQPAADPLDGALIEDAPVAPAQALTVRLSPDPVAILPAPSRRSVQVAWSGVPSYSLVFVDVCKRSITDPAFDVSEDCSTLSRLTPNGTANGSGEVSLKVFRGPNPDGETPWGCYAPGEQAPAGIAGSTCFVRVTHESVLNLDHDVETALTFVNGSEGQPGTSGPGVVRRIPLYSDEAGDEAAPSVDQAAADRAQLLAEATMVPPADGRAGLAAAG